MTSELIERVARALAGPRADEMVLAGNPIGEPCEYPRWMLHQLDARAAIATMQADAAPVAWMYERGSERKAYVERSQAALACGYAETALYAHPPVDNRVSTSSPVNDRGSGNMSGKLRDAMVVWVDAEAAYNDALQKPKTLPNKAAAAVIEADRKAVRAEQAAELDDARSAKDELRRLMDSIWRAEYMSDAPQWRPLDDLVGMVTQIDNMYAGVRDQRDALQAELAKFKALAETLAGAVDVMQSYGCPVCNGDCGSANPPVIFCPMTQCAEALRQYKEARDAS